MSYITPILHVSHTYRQSFTVEGNSLPFYICKLVWELERYFLECSVFRFDSRSPGKFSPQRIESHHTLYFQSEILESHPLPQTGAGIWLPHSNSFATGRFSYNRGYVQGACTTGCRCHRDWLPGKVRKKGGLSLKPKQRGSYCCEVQTSHRHYF